MLVLARKLGERVMVDGGIVVTVVEIQRGVVRLGFEMPDSVGVWREEILDKMRKEGKYNDLTEPPAA